MHDPLVWANGEMIRAPITIAIITPMARARWALDVDATVVLTCS